MKEIKVDGTNYIRADTKEDVINIIKDNLLNKHDKGLVLSSCVLGSLENAEKDDIKEPVFAEPSLHSETNYNELQNKIVINDPFTTIGYIEEDDNQ